MNEALNRDYVKGLAAAHSIAGAARILHLAEATVGRIIYGAPVSRGTLAHVELMRTRGAAGAMAISSLPLPTT